MSTLGKWEDDRSIDDTVFPGPAHRRGRLSHEQVARQKRITIASIDAACDAFFRSRGMPKYTAGNAWQRNQHELRPTD